MEEEEEDEEVEGKLELGTFLPIEEIRSSVAAASEPSSSGHLAKSACVFL